MAMFLVNIVIQNATCECANRSFAVLGFFKKRFWALCKEMFGIEIDWIKFGFYPKLPEKPWIEFSLFKLNSGFM